MRFKKKITKGIVALTALTILSTSAFGSISSAQTLEKPSISRTQLLSVPTSFSSNLGKPTGLNYSKVSTQYNFNLAKSGQIQPRGIFGHGLKAIKFIGSICRVGGSALSWILKPLSPSKAKMFSQWAHKIAEATERLNSASRGAVVKALIAVGVPEKTAEALADIILWLI
ncbi:hypothetical protein ERICI_03400 [Paenibacillus larvae subsp. larvae]|nr:hypothetical protein [Paenibacillus larvae]AVF23168.1 hypothetical protein ERICI_03400 [Paenibacillus larvae subsp. larvae]ETK26156.1 hypothetical protein ERIC1_2c03540 [Paenibacillus larvae subsp. larvae DSM 25719]MCY7488214.1 hypothetical protein [Paenibacillus larvae]MCY9563431.1 hypothetical protein [Paenibacillus larvae]MCY9567536.1 hypothetical protein [Paenibacillus larvae]